MDNAATARVKDLLAQNDKVAILVGKNPSFDQMAAALTLSNVLAQAGKQVTIASPSEPIVANSSLVGIDKVKTALSGDGGDLVVSFPYREGEIEKVSYTLEGGYLNIVVKATEDGLSFEQQDVVFKRSGGVPGLVFIIGTSRLADLGNLFDADALKNTAIINIDRQNDNQGFGDVVLVSPQASSLSELIGNLLQSLQMTLDQDNAQNLLAGISAATQNFQDGSTSFLAFEIAALCMRKGAKRIENTQRVAETSSPYGPFTMPQPKMSQQPQQQGSQRQSFPQQQQSREPKPVQQKPWEQRNAQPKQQQQQTPRQDQGAHQPSPMPQPAVMRNEQKPLNEVERKEVKPARNASQIDAGGDDVETPPDWLAPKVYKSSTLI